MTHFVALGSRRELITDGYQLRPGLTAYVEIKWFNHLVSRSDVVQWHADFSIDLKPHVLWHDDEVLRYEVGCEFDDPNHAMLFKLAFGGNA